MKKTLAVVSSLVIACTLFTGCGPQVTKHSENEIKIHLYEGGFGRAWIDDIITEYNSTVLKDSKYQIGLYQDKNLPDKIIPTLENNEGEAPYQLYISGSNDWCKGIYEDLFEDLTDVVNSSVDGNSTTIKDKMKNYDVWKDISSKNGEGIYCLPWDNSIMGMVIDHQDFISRGWYIFAGENDKDSLTEQGIIYTEQNGKLKFVSSTGKTNYKAGDVILGAGNDKLFGTYDDGQPTNETEFQAMLNRIKSSHVSPFIWGGGIDTYLDQIFNSVFAKYAGENGYNAFHRYDSNGEQIALSDGSNVAINVQNGYLVPQMKAVEDSYKFFNKYFKTQTGNLHSCCEGSDGQAMTQTLFLSSLDTTDNNAAILIDGNWWENEARNIFKEYGQEYGSREYRFLLLPSLAGEKQEKAVFSCTECGSFAIPKDDNKERLAITKDFLKTILKDENIRKTACATGYQLAYDYTLSEQEYESLTPFAKNVAEIYADSENIEIKYFPVDKASSPINFAGGKGTNRIFIPNINGAFPNSCVRAVNANSIIEIVAGLKKAYNEKDWQSYITKAQAQGFFKD